jgi:pimeloyl-ACP methyl ester carboxylesterase
VEQIEVQGRRITFERAGVGPPVVFVHGYVGDRRTWRGQLKALSDEYTAIAWDAPGFGGSWDPPEDFGLAGYADHLAAFVHELGIERAHIVGLSFGGGVAIELFDRHHDAVQTLTLVSAYAGWAGSLGPEAAHTRRRQALELAELPPEALLDALMPTMFASSVPKDAKDRFAMMLNEFRPAGLRATSVCFADADLRGVLPRIDVPTLLLYGDHDVRAPSEVARAIHDATPNSTLVLIPGVGHIVNIEAPDRFNDELRGFLGQHAGPAPP